MTKPKPPLYILEAQLNVLKGYLLTDAFAVLKLNVCLRQVEKLKEEQAGRKP